MICWFSDDLKRLGMSLRMCPNVCLRARTCYAPNQKFKAYGAYMNKRGIWWMGSYYAGWSNLLVHEYLDEFEISFKTCLRHSWKGEVWFRQSFSLRPYRIKSVILVGLGSDFKDLFSPLGFNTSNSSKTLFKVCLHCCLAGLGVFMGFGQFGGSSLKMAKWGSIFWICWEIET